MADVAAAAGVSQMTVSLTLRNAPSIPESTRKRIRTIATELGYRPDPVISRLMNQLRSGRISAIETIAWITSHSTKSGWHDHDASVAFFEGAQERADELGYRLENFWLTAPGMNGARLSQILHSRGIRGVLIPPLLYSGLQVDLKWELFTCATCGAFSMPKPHMHRACANYYGNMKITWDKLIESGHKRIALVLPQEFDTRTVGLWTAGFLRMQYSMPKAHRIEPFLPTTVSTDNLCKWFTKQRPDAVISLGKTIPEQLAKGLGIKPLRDYAYASLQAYDHTSGVDEQRKKIGSAALDLIIEGLNMNTTGLPTVPKTVLIDGVWKDGKTVSS